MADSNHGDTYIIRLKVPKGCNPANFAGNVCETVKRMSFLHPTTVVTFDNEKVRVATIRESDEPRAIVAVSQAASERVASEIILAAAVERRAELGVALAADYPPIGNDSHYADRIRSWTYDRRCAYGVALASDHIGDERKVTTRELDDNYRAAIIKALGHDAYRKVMKELT